MQIVCRYGCDRLFCIQCASIVIAAYKFLRKTASLLLEKSAVRKRLFSNKTGEVAHYDLYRLHMLHRALRVCVFVLVVLPILDFLAREGD